LEKLPLSSELAPLSFSLKVTLSQWRSLLSLVVTVNFFLLKRRHASSKELASLSWSTDIKKIKKTWDAGQKRRQLFGYWFNMPDDRNGNKKLKKERIQLLW
jgi:hypothetical protein